MPTKQQIDKAKEFHDTYERLAPQFGYETRKDTKQFDPETPNGKLMIAVCSEVINSTLIEQLEEDLKEWKSFLETIFNDKHSLDGSMVKIIEARISHLQQKIKELK